MVRLFQWPPNFVNAVVLYEVTTKCLQQKSSRPAEMRASQDKLFESLASWQWSNMFGIRSLPKVLTFEACGFLKLKSAGG
jgi:hypothetical protein